MIEILLQAERVLAVGLVDQAERLYRQAADADPRNSIAVVGLARVALERGDEPEAWWQAQRALAIDPENAAAQRLAGRLEEVWAYRGESLPVVATAEVAEAASIAAVAEVAGFPVVADVAAAGDLADVAEVAGASAPIEGIVVTEAMSGPATSDLPATPGPVVTPDPAPRPERSAIDRLLRRNRP